MTKITSFDRDNLRTLRPQIEAALSSVGKQFGLTFNLGGCTYFDKTAKFKLEVAAAKSNGKTQSPFEAAWEDRATLFGFKKKDLGKSFTYFGKTYTIIGLKPGARKRNVICSDDMNRMYRFYAHEVREGISRKN